MDKTNLSKIHPKFANEHQCSSCGGYFLDEDKDAVQCKRCVRDGRVNPLESTPEKDILHKDVNTVELSKKVAELEAIIDRLTKTNIEKIDKSSTKKYKPKKCARCDEEFTPASGAQKICQVCRQKLIS